MIGASFPHVRMRRMRWDEATRRMRRETHLSRDHLLLPLFVHEGASEEIASMPGCYRHSEEDLVKTAVLAQELGIPGVLIFPATDPRLKTLGGEEAYNPQGLTQRSIRAIKAACPQLLVFGDIALDPYTSHGQDGVLDERGRVDNDTTIAVLVKQALSQARAGVDFVSPSDMMDGRIGQIRQALDTEGFTNTRILSYSAKYASALYGPFRDAVGSKQNLAKSDKKNYQMDPANRSEAWIEAELDCNEGADMLMVKPGMFYLDIVSDLKQRFHRPVAVYQVSGEYAMIKLAAQAGALDEKAVVLESLLAFRRAGADVIISYYALEAARWIQS